MGELDGDSGVPSDVVECIQSVSSKIKELETILQETLDVCDLDVLAEMPPLERAYSFLTLAKTVSALYTLQLQCRGESLEEDELVQRELERLELYTNKVGYFMDRSTAKPATTVNVKAATRFIGHSLPDLTQDQRNQMRDITRGARSAALSRSTKNDQPVRRSVAAEAAAFLEKARMELLGINASRKIDAVLKDNVESDSDGVSKDEIQSEGDH
eukprot:TRINITY_DN629_c0_g2_i1.p1 TRINITY_DN629_c0_g2~~TRINITY_DN629_c0_g2_i1.p1  ORF type:complete len:214 (-),score=55.14 TRINITY_DN629_c0_g2_i1:264-905(-)